MATRSFMKKPHHRGRLGAPLVACSCLAAIFVGTACRNPTTTSTSSAAEPSASVGLAASSTRATASASATATASAVIPYYAGPTGKVAGRVVLKGDAPPDVPVPGTPKCPNAKTQYGKLFRVSADKGLADAVVGITEYTGKMPLPSSPVTVILRDCAFDQRVYTLSKGQPFELWNRDGEAYLPHLDGSRAAALLVAVPGARTPLHPRDVGRYALIDDLKHEWLFADVLVFAYPTHAVTVQGGAFSIPDVPVGPSKLSVFHPAIGRTVERQIVVKEGETLTLEVELAFDKKKDLKPAASATASAKGPVLPMLK